MFTVEGLERRALFSASVTDGSLVIDGTDGSELIRVTRGGTNYVVRDGSGGGIKSFPAEGVEEIVVTARGGDDTVRLDRVTVPVSVDAGAGNDRVFGGHDDDLIVGGDGNDRLLGRNGDDALDGGAGDDFLSGDFGDDDLVGGAGRDRVLGGVGFDSSDTDDDDVRGIEGLGILINFPDRFPVSGPPTFNASAPGFFPFPDDPVFPGFTSPPFTSNRITFGTTGLEVPQVGSNMFGSILNPTFTGGFVFLHTSDGTLVSFGSDHILKQASNAAGGFRAPLFGAPLVG